MDPKITWPSPVEARSLFKNHSPAPVKYGEYSHLILRKCIYFLILGRCTHFCRCLTYHSVIAVLSNIEHRPTLFRLTHKAPRQEAYMWKQQTRLSPIIPSAAENNLTLICCADWCWPPWVCWPSTNQGISKGGIHYSVHLFLISFHEEVSLNTKAVTLSSARFRMVEHLVRTAVVVVGHKEQQWVYSTHTKTNFDIWHQGDIYALRRIKKDFKDCQMNIWLTYPELLYGNHSGLTLTRQFTSLMQIMYANMWSCSTDHRKIKEDRKVYMSKYVIWVISCLVGNCSSLWQRSNEICLLIFMNVLT